MFCYNNDGISQIEAMLLLLPCIMAVVYQEKEGFAYLITAGVCGIVGGLVTIRKPKNTVFYLKEGCVTTALSWICLSFFGALPFLISGEIPSVTNALFETVSGFTTTGASILSDVEALSHCSNFWRCFTHWIGISQIDLILTTWYDHFSPPVNTAYKKILL